MRGLGLLILRLTVGIVSVAHGLPGLVPISGGRPADTAALLDATGVSAAYPVAVAAGLVQVLAGALLVIGAYTILSALLLAATTVATSWMLLLSNGLQASLPAATWAGHGYAFEFLRLGALACLMVAGPGALAHDARRARAKHAKRQTPAAAATRA